MEKLSPKCMMIMLLALASLATGIAVAPAGPGLPLAEDGERQPGNEKSSAGPDLHRMNCTGGDSINCHSRGNQAGL